MSESAADRPNVLVVFTDQQRWDTVGAYGSPMDITPNVDEAAADGTVFERAFTPQPVCGPARACVQTGTYATTCGGYDNGVTVPEPGDPSHPDLLANVFDRAGYDTGYVGKWHLSDATTEPVPAGQRGGYDFWRAADALEHTSHPYEGLVYDEDGDRVEFDGYRVDELTDVMIDFVERDRDAPFFGFLSYLEPHHQNDMGRYVAPEGDAFRHRNHWVPEDLAGHPGDWQAELPDYYGICERIDECYGRLLAALERAGELENTVVVFTSDHGSHFRTRNGEYKRSCHESSIRVPLVIRGPGFEDGGRVPELASLVDVPATLLDACGIGVPDRMEGASLLGLVDGAAGHGDGEDGDIDGDGDGDGGGYGDGAGSADEWREGVFVQPMSDEEVARVLRTDRWKYSVYAPAADRWENPQPDEYVERYLYDLRADPHEQRNLAGRRDYREVADRLRERLLDRIDAIEDERPTIRRRRDQA